MQKKTKSLLRNLVFDSFFDVVSIQNSPDRSGWMACVGCLFGSSVEMKGILEMPSNTGQYVRK